MRVHLVDYVTRHLGPWELSEAMLREGIPAAGDSIQVVELDGEIVGFVWVDLRADCLFLEEIHVIDSARGIGLGRKLLDEVERQARKHGRTEIQLGVFTDSPSIEFYRAVGFATIGEFPKRNQLHMRKSVR